MSEAQGHVVCSLGFCLKNEDTAIMGEHYQHVNRRLNAWHRDKIDHRDLHLSDKRVAAVFEIDDTHFAMAEQTPKFNLIDKMPPITDQGQEGSCTAESADALVTADMIRRGVADAFELSHQGTYYCTRAVEGTTSRDVGASCRDVYVAYSRFGYARAATYPYNSSQVTQKPPQAFYDEASKNLVNPIAYARVGQDLTSLKAAISAGYAVNGGMDVFRQLESAQAARTGILTMPRRFERPIGGHAVDIVGWDDTTQLLDWRNSWGTEWGIGGYGKMPYAMFLTTQIWGDSWIFRVLPAGTKLDFLEDDGSEEI